MRQLIVRLTVALASVWLVACAVPSVAPAPDGAARTETIYVLSTGWHTAIVAPRPEIVATGQMPEAADFPGAAFLEFGWGDRVYYPAPEETLGMTLRAAFTPTPAVMHVSGWPAAPDPADRQIEVERVALTADGLRHLIQAISDMFERPAGGRASPASPGLDPNSYFYNARGAFHFFNTCNTWTARMLRAGGVNLSPPGIVTAENVMDRLRAAIAQMEAASGP